MACRPRHFDFCKTTEVFAVDGTGLTALIAAAVVPIIVL
jgi:hypothetical protein